jgi:hypothetical protein
MGIKKARWRAKASKRYLQKIKPFELDDDKAYSFVCDEIIVLPVKSSNPVFKNIDLIICNDGYPLCRLKGGGDLLFLESSNRSFKFDVTYKNGLACIYPSMGRLRVDWDGCDLHVSRLADDSETV